MLSKWPIRNKLLIGIGLLLVIVATLSVSGFHGVYGYRSLVRSLSGRATELPLAAALSAEVANLRLTLSEISGRQQASQASVPGAATADGALGEKLNQDFNRVNTTLGQYRSQLDGNEDEPSTINDSHREWETLAKIDRNLARIASIRHDPEWIDDAAKIKALRQELDSLQALANEMPSHLHQLFHDFAREVRTQYRTLIVLTWITTISAAVLLTVLIRLFYGWVFRPLRLLVKGSRRVAAGEFGYRIKLKSCDEMAELAAAMNDMTDRFQAIRDDLDHQVQERTKQVVRSEQLASVGFLAAGVAHEINNPLASIAMCAESLESRFFDILESAGSEQRQELEVIGNYLRMIQNEAFRCKGITERLLDFSRMGDVERHITDLRELVQGVIDMVSHLGRYQDKRVEFAAGETVLAPVNAQELKQVVLNMITNGLDSLSAGGVVRIELSERPGEAVITFSDNGCGMTDEVKQHLFEPFFTRRRSGQGVGLGLSISYRIVADHDGHIDVHSGGPGRGSQFQVSLPLTEKKESEHRYQAA